MSYQLSPEDRATFDAITDAIVSETIEASFAHVPFPEDKGKPFGPDPDLRFKRRSGE